MNNKIEMTMVLKNKEDYTEAERKSGYAVQIGIEYNGKIYYFNNPILCSDVSYMQQVFDDVSRNGFNNIKDSSIINAYNEYKKTFMNMNKDYPNQMFIYRFKNNMIDCKFKMIGDYKKSKPVERKTETKNINYNTMSKSPTISKSVSSNAVKKQESQQIRVHDTKVKLTLVFKNKKSYTDNDWVRGHQLLVGLEYNGKRYPFSKEIIAPDDISKFLQKVRNDTSKNRGVKLEIDAYNEIVDATQRITNEYGGFGGKSLFLKMLDNEVEYINKEDDKIIISQKQEIESSDNELSGFETAIVTTSIAGFSLLNLASSAEDQNLFWIPLLSFMGPFISTFAATEDSSGLEGGVEAVVGTDANGNIVIKPKDGSSIVVDKDKIEQRAEYIYSKLNKNYNNLKSSIITDSKETANGILNILQSNSKEELLVRIKALEIVLKEQQEKLLNNDKGFQRTI